MNNSKDINYYLALPYQIITQYDNTDGEECWFAEVKELPGCMTQADSWAELNEEIQDAMRVWIETKIDLGQNIPEPIQHSFSGRFNVRIPKSLHQQLVRNAEEEGVSLNSLVTSNLISSLSDVAYKQRMCALEDEVRELRTRLDRTDASHEYDRIMTTYRPYKQDEMLGGEISAIDIRQTDNLCNELQ